MQTHFNLEAYTNYAKQWNKHALNATLLYSMDKTNSKDQNTGRAFMDVVGSAHYVYDNRYLLDFSLSGSASSILDPDDRWGIFPAVGAGWILSEESFLKRDWLNLLKVRASYGISGRADYSVNLFQDIYGSGNSYYFQTSTNPPASISGMVMTQLGIDGLTYEKSHKLNVGIDFMAWNRLSVSVDAFYDHRTDILVSGSSAVSSVFGMSIPSINGGIVDNRGVEASLAWDDQISNWKYHVGGQFSFARNKIVEQYEEYRPFNYLWRTGGSLGQIFGYEVIGIYQSQEEIDNRGVTQTLGDVRPGDLMFKDQNNDGFIDEFDQVALGYNSSVPEIYYGFNVGLEWKGIGVNAFFQGLGHYTSWTTLSGLYRPLTDGNAISNYYYANRWTPENPTARYPRLTTQTVQNNTQSSSVWLENGSFLKLRNMEIYYKLPYSLISKWHLNTAKVYVRGVDLFCWDHINEIDPASLGNGIPTTRSINVGLSVGF